MKLKIFSMLVVLGFISVLPMIYMGQFDPISFFKSGFKDSASELKKFKAKVPKNLTGSGTSEKVQVYKWRDENGVMQFSNTPPVNGSADQVEVNPNRNIVDAVEVPEPEESTATASPQVQAPNPYSPKGMKKVMDDAKGIEDLLQKRHLDQQKAMGGI